MGRKIRVMLVDDQPLVLEILSKGISKDQDIEIVGTATDGILALNQVTKLQPDVIILDMEMPRMNGIEFLHKLMPVNPIPTIVLSALTNNDSKITDEAFNAGAVDFLKKPDSGSKGLATLLVQLWTKIKIAATQDVSHFKKMKKEYRLPTNVLERNQKTNKIILGMGMMEISAEPGKEIKIYALGSCIGLAMFCPLRKIVGLSHIALPHSKTDPNKALTLPGYFADTAVPALYNRMVDAGCPPNKIYAKLAGGAKTRIEIGDYFGIGQKNTIAVKAGLLKAGITTLAEETGGNISRTVWMDCNATHLKLYYPEKGEWQI
jgi:chemotaxis receptor (MCP) glutamine deamidase CheD/DNA-binding NarL/FixJ family response regulator